MGDSFHRGDWLALAQSVVSIIAVVGAFGVVFLQNRFEKRRAEKRQRADARGVLMVATTFLEKAHQIVADIAEVRSDPGRTESVNDRNQQRYDIQHAIDIFKVLPVHVFPTEASTREIIAARIELASASFLAGYDGGQEDKAGNPEYGREWREWASRLETALNTMRAEANAFAE